MTMRASRTFCLRFCLGLVAAQAVGQARPTASAPGFAVPEIGGSLRYSVTVSEALSKGLYGTGQVASSTNVSGNVALLTDSKTHPLGFIYSGGYLAGNAGEPSPFFQNMAFSQALSVRDWNFLVSDAFNYLPQAASTGLSGVPGVGDVNATPVTSTGLGTLTTYSPRVNNTATLSANRLLTGGFSVQGSGTYTILRYLGDTGYSSATSGIDSSTEGLTGGFNYRVDARDNVQVVYTYGHSSFSGSQFAFTTQGVSAFYNRRWTRQLAVSVSGGPLRVSGSSPSLSGPALSLSAGASAVYTGRELTSSLNYQRGVGSGFGVIPGAISDSLQFGVNRSFGRAWGVAGTLGYIHTKSLPNLVTTSFTSNGVTASGQVSRAITQRISAFASYTIQDQKVQGASAGNNAFSGIFQVASFGITYSPSSIHLGAR